MTTTITLEGDDYGLLCSTLDNRYSDLKREVELYNEKFETLNERQKEEQGERVHRLHRIKALLKNLTTGKTENI